jgi:hypothetical protein
MDAEQAAWIEKLSPVLKGDQWALQYCIDVMFIAHLWDDLIDGDFRSKEDINEAFRIALIDIPKNPFYLAHIGDLRPLMMNVILQWQDANVLEKGNREDRAKAFMLKASVLQLFNYCAYLVGGPAWAIEVGPDVRRFYVESIDDYIGENNA